MHILAPSGWAFALAVTGALLVLVGFLQAARQKHSLQAVLGWLTLVDAGFIGIGLAFGSLGLLSSLLLLAFNGTARALAYFALVGMCRGSNQGQLLGIGKKLPICAFLFSLAMFAALGISPFFTPEGKPLLLFATINSEAWFMTGFIALANCAMVIFTVMAVHRVWLNGEYSFSAYTWRNEIKYIFPLPAVLAVTLAAMGIWGHDLILFAAPFAQQLPDALPNFALTWHPAVLLMYTGAAIVFLAGIINRSAAKLIAALLPLMALLLFFNDSNIAPLGRYFAIIVSGIGFLVALYSWGYIQKSASNAYYALLLLMFGSLAGIACADNLAAFFVFWELMTLSSYALVAWEDTEQAHAAAKKYFIMCSTAAAIMLPGLLLFQHWLGSMSVATLVLSTAGTSAPALAALLLVLVGFGVKAGLFPGHSWLPDAHPAAPSSISAPLSGVLTKAGIFGIFQIFLVICGIGLVATSSAGWVLCALGIATMLYGEIMALQQDDLKRLLAYSTMGQVGEICMTLGLCTWLASTGALMHVLNHAIMKDLLFLCSGALIMRAGTRKLADLRGMGKAMPFTAACMVLGLIAILGLPPFAGFMSKFMMLYALAEVSPLLAGLMLLASLAGCVYYTRIIKTLIFEPYEGAQVAEAPWSMRLPMAILAGLCIVLGLFPQLSLNNLIMPILNSLDAGGKLVAQSLPLLAIKWPLHSVLLLCGAFVPVLLRKNRALAGKSAAALLAAAALLVIAGRAEIDTLSFIFALAITVIGCVNMLYSVGYMEHSHTQWRFYAFFLCMCAGLTGVAVSSSLFSFFVFWEIMSSWSLYFVIVHDESPEALREGFKYFFFNVLGAAFLFLGVVLAIQWSGGAEFSQIRAALPQLEVWKIATFLGLMSIGFIMKAAQLPFRIDIQMHPAVAPTPVSGYISSVLLKSAIFGLAKLFMVLGGGIALTSISSTLSLSIIMNATVWIGGITIVMAATYAVFQTDIKLVLIYSTVSQLGYMIVGIGLGTSLGIAGGLLHLVNHVFFKDLLFLVAGAVILQTHRQSMNRMGGLGLKMPATLAFFCIGAVCVIGLPPSSGFTSKWILYHALMEQGFVLVALLSLVGSVLTLAYMSKMMHSVFLGQLSPEMENVSEAPRIMLWPMGFMAAGCVLTSFFPGLVLKPLNIVLAEFALPQLDIALWGINSGTGAWNATLTGVLMAAVWIVANFALSRFSRKQRITEVHVCGIPPEELNLNTTPDDIYSTPVNIIDRWRNKKSTSGA